jgi:hypothetical protein
MKNLALLFVYTTALTSCLGAIGPVVINEIVTSNSHSLVDEDGDSPDWFELLNISNQRVNLVGWGVSDDRDMPFKWVFGGRTGLAPGETLLVYASGKDRLPRHTNFKLDAEGEELILVQAQGQIADHVVFAGLPRDVSYGRQPDGTGDFLFLADPTPGRANETPGSAEYLTAPVFSHAGGFYVADFDLSLTSLDPQAAIHYTLDGSEPTESDLLYTEPIAISEPPPNRSRERIPTHTDISRISTSPHFRAPTGKLFRGQIVRARAFKPNAVASTTITRSFWVDDLGRARYTLPVVSLVTDQNNLFDPDIGIYVAGHAEGDNYSQRGPAWERPVHVEFYETDNTQAFAQDADLKIHGNTSQNFPIKGLDLDGTGGQGHDPFRYAIFPNRTRTEYEHILLRPSGHDYNRAIMRDEFMQSLAAEVGAQTQAHRACIVFINGVYWGLHYLKEKQDAEFVSYYGDVPEQDIDYLEGYAQPKAGDTRHYQAMIDTIATQDITLPHVYAQVRTRMDVENYMDYKALEIFYYRWDIGNHRLWRARTPTGRWQWLQFDNDVGWGGFWAEQPAWEFNMLKADLTPNASLHGHNNATTTFLLRRLMANPDFRRDFIIRCCDLLNSVFQPTHTIERIDRMAAELEPEIDEHTRRWRAPSSLKQWQDNIEYMRTFARERPAYMQQHLKQHFRLRDPVKLTMASTHPDQGRIQVNSLHITAPLHAPWTGLYFQDMPITITATPAPGYHFTGWQNQPDLNTPSLELSLTEDVTLTAEFAVDPDA